MYLILCADRVILFRGQILLIPGALLYRHISVRCSGVGAKKVAPTEGAPPGKMRREQLLEKLQHGLLRLVGLRESGHAGLLEDVVLGHLRNRFADVSVLNVVLRAGQVRDFGVLYVDVGSQLVDRSADSATSCGNRS